MTTPLRKNKHATATRRSRSKVYRASAVISCAKLDCDNGRSVIKQLSNRYQTVIKQAFLLPQVVTRLWFAAGGVLPTTFSLSNYYRLVFFPER